MARELQGLRQLEAEATEWEPREVVLQQWVLKELVRGAMLQERTLKALALAPVIPMGGWSEEDS